MADDIFNLDQLNELADGDQDFVMSMVDTFLEHTPQQFAELKRAKDSGDLATVGGIAHKIKPNIDLFGLEDIKETIREVEQKGKDGEGGPALDAAVEKLEATLETAFEQLKALR